MTNCVGAQLGGTNNSIFYILNSLFSILYSLFSINTNPLSLSCWKHLTAIPTFRKCGNEMKHHKTENFFLSSFNPNSFQSIPIREILSGWQTGWGRNLGANNSLFSIFYFLYSIFYILNSQLSINTNLRSLSCWKHLTATPTFRKLGNET